MAPTSAQASALMNEAYLPDQIRAAARNAFRGRVLQPIADPSADAPCTCLPGSTPWLSGNVRQC